MYVKNVRKEDLLDALNTINSVRYGGNIKFKRLEPVGRRFLVTLTVKESAKTGGSRSPWNRNASGNARRIAAACWHVHGHFFDALLDIAPDAEIKALDKIINREGGNWHDYNRGSLARPASASECCEC